MTNGATDCACVDLSTQTDTLALTCIQS